MSFTYNLLLTTYHHSSIIHLMHICVFGGAFDPPHVGHHQVASSLITHTICDEVWFEPVKMHPFGKVVLANGHREKMLQLILEPHMQVDTYELNHEGNDFTLSFDTLEALSSQYPEHTFSWVMGSDNLAKFHLWGNFQGILDKYPVYVYPRKGFPFEPLRKGMTALKNFPEVTVSSTEVRSKIATGQSITGLVDPKVEKYIRENKLYVVPSRSIC